MAIRNTNRDGENEPCVFFKQFLDYHRSMPCFAIVSMSHFDCVKKWHSGCQPATKSRGVYWLIWPIRGCSAGLGMVFVLSVVNWVYNFV